MITYGVCLVALLLGLLLTAVSGKSDGVWFAGIRLTAVGAFALIGAVGWAAFGFQPAYGAITVAVVLAVIIYARLP